jgi:serine/threonine protein kinase
MWKDSRMSQPASANENVPERKVLGEGAFGIVVGPALPNRNASGKNIHYPRNVTKMFRNKVNYNKAMTNSNVLKEKVPKGNVAVHEYQRTYTLKNLNTYLSNEENRNKVKTFLKGYENDTVVPMLRLPNLGTSVDDILINEEGQIHRFRTLPFREVCAQLYKCMDVIQSIREAKHIHGDIRHTNLLIDLNTGNMTIIDFDWLMPFDEFFKRYPQFFINQPPECLFIWGRYENNSMMRYLSLNEENTRNIYTATKKLESNYKYDEDAAAAAITAFRKGYPPKWASLAEIDAARKSLFEIAKETIDSYGFAYAIDDLFDWTWADITEKSVGGKPFAPGEYATFNRIRNFVLDTMIPSMMDDNYEKRWDITTAMTEFKEELDGNGFDVEDYLKTKYGIDVVAKANKNKSATTGGTRKYRKKTRKHKNQNRNTQRKQKRR